MLVSLRLDENVKDLVFGVDCAREIDHAPIDFQIDLVKMPNRMRSGTALAQFNSALREQILTKAKRESEITLDRLVMISGGNRYPE